MFAVGEHFQNGDPACQGASRFCDAECFNVFTLIWQWMVYTPEFFMTSVTVSSPVALLAALWGMTPRVLFERRMYEGRAMNDALILANDE